MHSIGNGNRTVVYDGKIAGLYDLEETLGSGHFAVVKLARHVFTGEKVAVKVIDKTKLDEVSRAHLFQEVRCMKLVQHPNVVRLYEVIDTQTKLYLILELGDGGDLYDYIMKHEGGLSENLAREYFRQIVRAISYCHQLHVVHRDLKPENVVFFEKLGVVKLTDFGFSNKFCPGQKLETSCGSLAYSAPEILLGDSYDAPAVDIWSLGVILYMLVCGQPPFEKANDSETLTMIMDCKYTMPPHVSNGCRRLISMMLVREPEKRATLSQIASDPWLTQGTSNNSGNSNNSNIDGGLSQQLHKQQQQQDNIPEYLPLVSRQQVSDDDHTLIINKMVSGNIATKEEILDALDRNEYNHITATYFLLAERKLRQKRQEQLQKRRPELSLPVTTSSRITPRTRTQGTNRDIKPIIEGDDTNNHLLVPTNNQLCTPRTPGAETTGGRSRKCSIVQEEDDEDEISGCTNRDELTTPLNRRGSRSEGRINIAIQDRVECERLKKDKETSIASAAAATNAIGTAVKAARTNKMTVIGSRNQNLSKGLENISGIKIINKDTNNVRLRLGTAGGNRIPLDIEKRFEKNLKLPESVLSADSAVSTITTIETGKRKSSIPDSLKSSGTTGGRYDRQSDVIQTKVLTDSSTIQIPITTMSTSSIQDSNIIPKYKTMPSPTRPTIVLSGPGTRELNEIFEEGTDIGSSDTSATTTPRPITRNTHFTSRSSAATPQRKSKFHKTRTPSCSSSDASDDDSESRKKRAHKMTDVSKPLQPQRRDSHDDSSDSQDQGNAPSSGGGAGTASSYLVYSSTTSSNQDNSGDRTTQNGSTTSSTSNTQNSTTNSIGDNEKEKIYDKTEQQQQPVATTTHFRRHRAGRRRAGETRLRESQSLNRITEVQEIAELTVTPSIMPINSSLLLNHTSTSHNNSHNNNNTIIKSSNHNHVNNNNNNIHKINNNYSNNGGITCGDSLSPTTATITETVTTPVTTPTIITKPKGLSARLFQGFIRKNDFIQQMPPSSNTEDKLHQSQNSINGSHHEMSDNVDGNKVIVNGVDFAKGICVTATCDSGDRNDTNGIGVGGCTTPTATKTSSTTKKLKMLGRYFQVHKKLCIPLPGLFQKGRLYKAQSCGSLVRDKITNNPVMVATVAIPPTQKENMKNPSDPIQLQQQQQQNKKFNVKHSTAVLFGSGGGEKGKILRNCLSGKFLSSCNDTNSGFNGSGDINQNQNHDDYYYHRKHNRNSTLMTTSATELTSSSSNHHSNYNFRGNNFSRATATEIKKRNSISTDGYRRNSNYAEGDDDPHDIMMIPTAAAAAASLLQQFCSALTTSGSSLSSPSSSSSATVAVTAASSESGTAAKTFSTTTTKGKTPNIAAIAAASATTTLTATAVSSPTAAQISINLPNFSLPNTIKNQESDSNGKGERSNNANSYIESSDNVIGDDDGDDSTLQHQFNSDVSLCSSKC